MLTWTESQDSQQWHYAKQSEKKERKRSSFKMADQQQQPQAADFQDAKTVDAQGNAYTSRVSATQIN